MERSHRALAPVRLGPPTAAVSAFERLRYQGFPLIHVSKGQTDSCAGLRRCDEKHANMQN
eukprot:13515-Heterococcus_DN1.PRE.2